MNQQQRSTRRAQTFQLAMQSGAKVGLFFILQAVSLLLYRWGFISNLLFIAALIMVPVSLVMLTNQYRDQYLGGYMRYMEGVGFMMWTYLFSLIIGTVAFYISTRILLNSPAFIASMDQTIEIFMDMMDGDPNAELIMEGLKGITPRSLTISMITSALFFGLIFIYIAGLFTKRSYGK